MNVLFERPRKHVGLFFVCTKDGKGIRFILDVRRASRAVQLAPALSLPTAEVANAEIVSPPGHSVGDCVAPSLGVGSYPRTPFVTNGSGKTLDAGFATVGLSALESLESQAQFTVGSTCTATWYGCGRARCQLVSHGPGTLVMLELPFDTRPHQSLGSFCGNWRAGKICDALVQRRWNTKRLETIECVLDPEAMNTDAHAKIALELTSDLGSGSSRHVRGSPSPPLVSVSCTEKILV